MKKRSRAHGVLLLTTVCAASLFCVSAPAFAQTHTYDIPATSLSQALRAFGKESGRQLIFTEDLVRGKQSARLHGNFTPEEALRHLLAETGLMFEKAPSGAIMIQRAPSEAAIDEARDKVRDIYASQGRTPDGKSAIPDILVVGTKNWNLNLDIQRTRDDAQPYVVFDHDQIERSGATNLDDFFRNYLGSNTSGSTSLQQRNSKSQSIINLRGLGSGATLILVDGRRYSQGNTGSGVIDQSSINGIPLDAIERVEVLASSASGIYGSDAVGGVINIIMRRNYRGIEANAYYGNTGDFKAADRRLTLSGSFPIEHGKTRISFTGAWQKTDSLLSGERDFAQRGRAFILKNDPNYVDELGLLDSATPNVISQSGANLVLKPQYAVNGVTNLGSNVTFVPRGFRGVGQDGAGALLANAGQQNQALAPGAVTPRGGAGKLATLLNASQQLNGSLTVKRTFNKWLSAYGEFDYSRFNSPTIASPVPDQFQIAAGAASNPFTQAITVSVPSTQTQRLENISSNKRLLAGVVVALPFNWQADLDGNWNWGRFRSIGAAAGLTQATIDGITKTGTINVLQDVLQNPIPYDFLQPPFGTVTQPSRSSNRSYTLKAAGPAPWLKLWGGKPIVTLQVEENKTSLGDSLFIANNLSFSSIGYTPQRSQTTDSVYGEVRLPILGKDNHVPLFRGLELQLAYRYDHYIQVGANSAIQCVSHAGALLPAEFDAACPPAVDPTTKLPIQFVRTRSGSVNPVIAVKWSVFQDLAFRGSYSTGYQPPFLNALTKNDGQLTNPFTGESGQTIVNVTDPRRGNEAIGTPFLGSIRLIPAELGGNPDLAPQTSKSWSFGTIVTPHILPGLRLSLDWTRITQNNTYFLPSSILFSFAASVQPQFNDFLAAHPERFTRAALTDADRAKGYTVGAITNVDVSWANLSYARSDSLDFAASYDHGLFGGALHIDANATWQLTLESQQSPSQPLNNFLGVAGASFFAFPGSGGVSWKGNATASYSADKWSLGWRVHHFSGYWLSQDHSLQPLQGSARVSAQTYHDLFGSYKILPKTTLAAGVNNVLGTRPPVDTSSLFLYSFYGDPKLRSFYVSLKQSF
ncbi:TonB-dependent receptor [Sphingomonas mali]|uniref:TonB-dependent receptor n=1 Tax=Sphingomonas mali TaxID=40682 RepID=UPI000A4F79A4|nr:TonB-dependent receptor [Sphingomonas mali]